MQPAMLALQLCNRASLVGGGLVEQHDERAGQVAQQLAQEMADLVLADVVEEEQIVEAQAVPPRAERDSRDDGDFVPPSLTVAMDGGLPLRSPCPGHVGYEQKARFLGKD